MDFAAEALRRRIIDGAIEIENGENATLQLTVEDFRAATVEPVFGRMSLDRLCPTWAVNLHLRRRDVYRFWPPDSPDEKPPAPSVEANTAKVEKSRPTLRVVGVEPANPVMADTLQQRVEEIIIGLVADGFRWRTRKALLDEVILKLKATEGTKATTSLSTAKRALGNLRLRGLIARR
jgi:hypothetical protein